MVSALTLPFSHTDSFKRQFDTQLASSDDMRRRVFALRCKVFCEELGFAMTQAGGHESDQYDQHSLHCLIQHKPDAADVGCVRLVLPGERGGNLPFEKFGLLHVDRKLLDWRELDPTRCCEVSRLAVLESHRRPWRADTATQAHADESKTRTRDLPSVVLALYQAIIAMSLDRDFEWNFMVGEPRLARHLDLFGIRMRQISPTFEYFGPRAVFVASKADFQAAVDGWRGDRRALYDFVEQQLVAKAPAINNVEAIRQIG
jgi:N-acyl amino acid synthase of PEP-CTERM/exosortase system